MTFRGESRKKVQWANALFEDNSVYEAANLSLISRSVRWMPTDSIDTPSTLSRQSENGALDETVDSFDEEAEFDRGVYATLRLPRTERTR